MENKDLVSVIIPLYNHELYIKECIESVINQTYKNIEVIIIDDGSKDGSYNAASKIKDSRIQLFQQVNCGAHNAINRGLLQAKGKYVSVLNSDDIFELNRIEKAINVFHKDLSLTLVSSWINIIDNKGKHLGVKEGWKNCEPWPIKNPDLSYKATDSFSLNLLMSNFVSTTSNMIFRREIISDVGLMRNLRFAHDWDFLLRVAEKYKCFLIEEPLLKYRIHQSNTISSNREWMLFEVCWVLASNIKRFQGSHIFASNTESALCEDITRLMESLNFQGNDKVFWGIRAFIDSMEKLGVTNPEEMLLDNKTIREKFIEYII